MRERLETRATTDDLVVFLNTADDPLVERIVTPRLALTVAEHLAFDRGRHVLVVMADMTSYCEAVREVASSRGEIPSRRGYPGYLYSDLASLYERAGRIHGKPGSVTQIPVLTMPGEDITHPVPDLTGYITEGQIVLSHDLHVRGVYPPFDPLRSLSRLMRLGAGDGKTRGDHLELSAQLYALVAQARRVADLAEVVGADALSAGEARYLGFAEAFEAGFVQQGADEHALARRDAGPRLAGGLGHAARRVDRWSPRRRSPPATGKDTMPLRAPPGRAGRLWLVRRLEVARRGVEVLDQKRQTLLREQQRLSEVAGRRHAGLGAEGARCGRVERPCARDRRRTAAAARGRAGSGRCEVEVEWRNALGTVFPAGASVHPGPERDFVALGGGSVVAFAARAHAEAVAAAAGYAAARAAHEAITAELAATARRQRAIERRWIPEHEAALHRIELDARRARARGHRPGEVGARRPR